MRPGGTQSGPDDLMSLVYTSGTTGNPKGAMLTHGNMAAALDGANAKFPQFHARRTMSFLSFLPLSPYLRARHLLSCH